MSEASDLSRTGMEEMKDEEREWQGLKWIFATGIAILIIIVTLLVIYQ
jgi:hypothetical protein